MIAKKALVIVSLMPVFGFAQTPKEYDKQLQNVMPNVVEWRRDFHQNPELSNREFKTQAKIIAHLQSLGIEVRTMAKTGVIGSQGCPAKRASLNRSSKRTISRTIITLKRCPTVSGGA